MSSYGQFCSMARAHDVLGGRWTLLVVRELLFGSCRFNDIRRGIPRISRTMLSERLHMRRRVRFEALPKHPFVLRFEINGCKPHFMLLKTVEASLCTQNPGFPEALRVRSPLSALVSWWRGDVTFHEAQRLGMTIEGPKALARAFPSWFDRYLFAHIGPATGRLREVAARETTRVGAVARAAAS